MTRSVSSRRSRRVVDEDAGELVAHGPVHQRCGDGGVHAAGEGADDAAGPHLLADAVHALGHEAAGRPVAPAAADVVEEVLQDALALGRVDHLGVELEPQEARAVAHDGDGRVLRVGQGVETRRHLGDDVAVAHPDRHRRGQPLEDGGAALSLVDHGRAVLAALARGDAAPQLVGQQLHAVADAEHRQAALEDVGGGSGRPFVVDAGRPAGEDEAPRPEAGHLLPGRVVGDELAVDAALAHTAGDEHAVLGAEVEDGDGLGRRRGLGWGNGLLTFPLAGDLKVGGDLEVVAGGDPPPDGQSRLVGRWGAPGLRRRPASRARRMPVSAPADRILGGLSHRAFLGEWMARAGAPSSRAAAPQRRPAHFDPHISTVLYWRQGE